MQHYSLKACESFIEKEIEKGSDVFTKEEGGLGLGTVVIIRENGSGAIIKERYLNEWSSTHTARQYRKMPKKYITQC
jgi:hypothetical protein